MYLGLMITHIIAQYTHSMANGMQFICALRTVSHHPPSALKLQVNTITITNYKSSVECEL